MTTIEDVMRAVIPYTNSRTNMRDNSHLPALQAVIEAYAAEQVAAALLPCVVNQYLSCVCVCGTKGCNVEDEWVKTQADVDEQVAAAVAKERAVANGIIAIKQGQIDKLRARAQEHPG